MDNMTKEQFQELDELAGKIIDWRRKHGIQHKIFCIGLARLLELHEELRERKLAEEIIEKALKVN